jgi:flagellar hook-length control protein FliK
MNAIACTPAAAGLAPPSASPAAPTCGPTPNDEGRPTEFARALRAAGDGGAGPTRGGHEKSETQARADGPSAAEPSGAAHGTTDNARRLAAQARGGSRAATGGVDADEAALKAGLGEPAGESSATGDVPGAGQGGLGPTADVTESPANGWVASGDAALLALLPAWQHTRTATAAVGTNSPQGSAATDAAAARTLTSAGAAAVADSGQSATVLAAGASTLGSLGSSGLQAMRNALGGGADAGAHPGADAGNRADPQAAVDNSANARPGDRSLRQTASAPRWADEGLTAGRGGAAARTIAAVAGPSATTPANETDAAGQPAPGAALSATEAPAAEGAAPMAPAAARHPSGQAIAGANAEATTTATRPDIVSATLEGSAPASTGSNPGPGRKSERSLAAADAARTAAVALGVATARTDKPSFAEAKISAAENPVLRGLEPGQSPGPALPAAAAPASSATPTEARIAASPGTADFASQLGAQLTTFVRDGVQHARLELNPADLGPVQVQIQLDGATAQVNLAADHAHTRQALEQALPLLAGGLREAGFTLTGGGVFEQPRQPPSNGSGGDPGSSGNPRAGRDSNGDGDGHGDGDLISAPAFAAPRRRGVVDLVA